MANATVAFGFRAHGPVLRMNPYSVDGSYGTTLFLGDCLAGHTDGTVIAGAATSTQIVGVHNGYRLSNTALTGTSQTNVLDDPDQRYVVKSGSTTATQTMINNNCDHVAGAGSTITHISGHYIDTGTVNTTTYTWRMLDFRRAPDNEKLAAYSDFIVVCNEHSWAKTTTGV